MTDHRDFIQFQKVLESGSFMDLRDYLSRTKTYTVAGKNEIFGTQDLLDHFDNFRKGIKIDTIFNKVFVYPTNYNASYFEQGKSIERKKIYSFLQSLSSQVSLSSIPITLRTTYFPHNKIDILLNVSTLNNNQFVKDFKEKNNYQNINFFSLGYLPYVSESTKFFIRKILPVSFSYGYILKLKAGPTSGFTAKIAFNNPFYEKNEHSYELF